MPGSLFKPTYTGGRQVRAPDLSTVIKSITSGLNVPQQMVDRQNKLDHQKFLDNLATAQEQRSQDEYKWKQEDRAKKLLQEKAAQGFLADEGKQPDKVGGTLNLLDPKIINGMSYTPKELDILKGINLPVGADGSFNDVALKATLASTTHASPDEINSIVNKTKSQVQLSNFANAFPGIAADKGVDRLTEQEYTNQLLKKYPNLPTSMLTSIMNARVANTQKIKDQASAYDRQIANIDKQLNTYSMQGAKAQDAELSAYMKATSGGSTSAIASNKRYLDGKANILKDMRDQKFGKISGDASTAAVSMYDQLTLNEHIDPKVARQVINDSIAKKETFWGYGPDELKTKKPEYVQLLLKRAGQNSVVGSTSGGATKTTAREQAAIKASVLALQAQKKALESQKANLYLSPEERRRKVVNGAWGKFTAPVSPKSTAVVDSKSTVGDNKKPTQKAIAAELASTSHSDKLAEEKKAGELFQRLYLKSQTQKLTKSEMSDLEDAGVMLDSMGVKPDSLFKFTKPVVQNGAYSKAPAAPTFDKTKGIVSKDDVVFAKSPLGSAMHSVFNGTHNDLESFASDIGSRVAQAGSAAVSAGTELAKLAVTPDLWMYNKFTGSNVKNPFATASKAVEGFSKKQLAKHGITGSDADHVLVIQQLLTPGAGAIKPLLKSRKEALAVKEMIEEAAATTKNATEAARLKVAHRALMEQMRRGNFYQ